MKNNRDNQRSAIDELDGFILCAEFLFRPTVNVRYQTKAEIQKSVRTYEEVLRIKLRMPDAGTEQLVQAWRLKRVRDYIRRRRSRAPRTHEPAGRVVFAHDSELADSLQELVDIVNQDTAKSAQNGQGGRAGMTAALRIAAELLQRVPGADLTPIVVKLNRIEVALRDLDDGIVHDALVPKPRQVSGPPPNRRKIEFKCRCTIAAILSKQDGDVDPFKKVFTAASESASIAYKRRFSSNTVRNWVEEHTTEVNRAARERSELPPENDDVACAVGMARMLKAVGLSKLIYLRSLAIENIDRSIWEVGQDVMEEFNVKVGPATG